MKKTVMIVGISSFVGSNLAQLLGDEYRIVGTYFETPVNIPGVTCVPCDVLKKDYVFKLMAIFKPDFTIYAAGLSSLAECDRHPKKADAINSAGAVNCSGASERYGSRFIYISSCFVLGGDDVVYKESDTPFPATVYGTSLSSTEFYVQRSCLNYLILRCAPLYGRSYNPLKPNWFESVQATLAKNESLPADDSVQTGFLDIVILGRIIKALLSQNVYNRLLHVSTKDVMTRMQFAKTYAQIFRKDPNLVISGANPFPIDQNAGKVQVKVASEHFFKLDVTNLEEILGTTMPKIEESLKLTLQRFSAKI